VHTAEKAKEIIRAGLGRLVAESGSVHHLPFAVNQSLSNLRIVPPTIDAPSSLLAVGK
jgi:hypothetical protein